MDPIGYEIFALEIMLRFFCATRYETKNVLIPAGKDFIIVYIPTLRLLMFHKQPFSLYTLFYKKPEYPNSLKSFLDFVHFLA